MTGSTHSSEEYWGSTISITAEPQGDGSWNATSVIHAADATAAATKLRTQGHSTAEAAQAAARALATAEIDSQRAGRGKP